MFCQTDSFRICLLDVPFVETRNTHGHFVPAEDHTAFDIDLAAHVEGLCLGILCQDGFDYRSLHAGTDEHFGAILGIPKFQQFSDGFDTCQTVAFGTAGEHRIDAQLTGL